MGIEDTLFQLRMSSKQLERLAKKAQKDQILEKAKVKKAIESKDIDTAQIYAENAIRKKNEYLNYLRLSSRLDAVSSKVKSAVAMQNVAKNIGNISKSLERAMADLDLEKVSKIMEKFESQFEELDVRSGVMEGAMSSAVTLSTPQNEVDSLIKQVAEENGLEIMDKISEATQIPNISIGGDKQSADSRSKAAEDQLTSRLASLRN
jgi:charged multivesicular body protein 1